MADVKLSHVYKEYEGGVVAVQDFNLHIKDKEFIVLVGPSGCGKSTTLRMIAGLEEITAGEIYIGDVLLSVALVLLFEKFSVSLLPGNNEEPNCI